MLRRLASEDLESFVEYTKPDWQTAKHHREMFDVMAAFERGEITRLLLEAPPRHSKSETASRRFPAFCLGRTPGIQIVCSTYNQDFANDLGREVRQIIMSPEYHQVFGEGLRKDSKAADRFHLTNGSQYVAVGTGSSLTGRGMDIGVIDDPVKDREDAESERMRNRNWDWFRSTFYTRQMPKARLMVMACLVGDTSVTMADGSYKTLADIEVGDRVKTLLGESEVTNWRCCGDDSILSITTKCGKVVRGNARHPFLVWENGEMSWVRLEHLKTGDLLVGEPIVEKPAKSKDVKSSRYAVDSAKSITVHGIGKTGKQDQQQINTEKPSSSIDTASRSSSTTRWSKIKAVYARFVTALQNRKTRPTTSTGWSSTTVMTPKPCVACCAMNVTLGSGISQTKNTCQQQLTTCEIVRIERDGVEPVYDIEVTPHEHFLSNHLYSHNTRWHEDDLTGRILEHEGDNWHRVTLPAIRDEGTDHEEALWPEWYPLDTLKDIRATIGPRDWLSLYQQKPTTEEGTIFQRHWFDKTVYTQLPENLNYYLSGDFAVTSNAGDWTVLILWGIDSHGNMYGVAGWAGQATADVWIEQLIDMITLKPVMAFIGESGPIRRSVEPMLRNRMDERNTSTRLVWLPHSTGNKTADSRSLQAMASLGRVRLPTNAVWAEQLIDELMKFPDGKRDDFADAAFLMARYVHKTVSAAAPRRTAVQRNLPGQSRILNVKDFLPNNRSVSNPKPKKLYL